MEPMDILFAYVCTVHSSPAAIYISVVIGARDTAAEVPLYVLLVR